ncbi:response regulator transcription factor [Paenibacillaceae bacterium T2]|uniref:Response regulator transcription factor n=1 Tax=Ferviditalea candida TaxID=3108399 RepID=A0ABU5ZK27_9BACL|nr:response regulator transcription factor [Paenibacillaceae bacterium T2]
MTFQIYLVEDEFNLNQVLTSYLQKEGWQVRSFLTGEEARAAIADPPHLWILDIMLPDIDGFQLIREIKAHSPQIPVVFISARDADLDRIIGLEMGSDDYLAKPFLPRELVIRTRKLLKRIYEERTNGTESERFNLLPYALDEKKRTVYESERMIELTSKEFDILLLFARNQGQAFSREHDHSFCAYHIESFFYQSNLFDH